MGVGWGRRINHSSIGWRVVFPGLRGQWAFNCRCSSNLFGGARAKGFLMHEAKRTRILWLWFRLKFLVQITSFLDILYNFFFVRKLFGFLARYRNIFERDENTIKTMPTSCTPFYYVATLQNSFRIFYRVERLILVDSLNKKNLWIESTLLE